MNVIATTFYILIILFIFQLILIPGLNPNLTHILILSPLMLIMVYNKISFLYFCGKSCRGNVHFSYIGKSYRLKQNNFYYIVQV